MKRGREVGAGCGLGRPAAGGCRLMEATGRGREEVAGRWTKSVDPVRLAGGTGAEELSEWSMDSVYGDARGWDPLVRFSSDAAGNRMQSDAWDPRISETQREYQNLKNELAQFDQGKRF